MKYRTLGRTGLKVSALSIGTVSLGVDYGIRAPSGFGVPNRTEALNVLRRAREAGVNLFDTAPAYGESERLLGEALGGDSEMVVATKVSCDADEAARSVERSLHDLRRERLDIVQIHNASVDVIRRGEVTAALVDQKRRGKVGWIGASVYTEAEALEAIQSGAFDVLQVSYSLLDQRPAAHVFIAAQEAGVGIMTRSVLMKGALTSKAAHLPAELSEVKRAAEKAMRQLSGTWEGLPEIALRFSLSAPVSTVLLGPRTLSELEEGLRAAEAGPLPGEFLKRARGCGTTDEAVLDPRRWNLP